jgi:hypothetical protein
MISEKQREAARANGAQSHGPKTPDGKSHSSRNATTHGLLSNVVVLPNESVEGFDNQVSTYLTRFRPVDDFEMSMIEEMAASYWRIRRAWAIERSMMASALDRQPYSDHDAVAPLAGAFCELADSGRLALLHRYESRLHLMYQRAVRTLLLTRSAGPGQPESSPPAGEPSPPEPEAAPDSPRSEPEPMAVEPVSSPTPSLELVTPDVPQVLPPSAIAAHNTGLPNEPKNPPSPTHTPVLAAVLPANSPIDSPDAKPPLSASLREPGERLHHGACGAVGHHGHGNFVETGVYLSGHDRGGRRISQNDIPCRAPSSTQNGSRDFNVAAFRRHFSGRRGSPCWIPKSSGPSSPLRHLPALSTVLCGPHSPSLWARRSLVSTRQARVSAPHPPGGGPFCRTRPPPSLLYWAITVPVTVAPSSERSRNMSFVLFRMIPR